MARDAFTILDLDRTIAAGGNETETTEVATDRAAVQIEVSGGATDVDVHIETRLADDAAWSDWISPRTGLADGASETLGVDTGGVGELRVRVVNNDGAADATARVVISS